MKKPVSSVLAAFYLSSFSDVPSGPAQQAFVDEEPHYSTSESGSGRTVREEAVIPLRGLVENDRSVTMLQDVINGFRK